MVKKIKIILSVLFALLVSGGTVWAANQLFTVDNDGNVTANQIITNTISATGTDQSISINPAGTGKLLVGGDSIVVASKSSAPTGPKAGQIYFDTNSNKLRVYNGTNWLNLNTTSVNSHSLDLEESSTQYASIADASQTGLDLNSDFTIEAWVKLESISAGTHLIVYKEDAPTGRGYSMYYDENGKVIVVFWSNDSTGSRWETNNSTLTTGSWQYIAVAINIGTPSAQFYKNGVAITTNTISSNATSIQNNNKPFVIGAYSIGSSNLIDGLIDEVRVWLDVRTSTEISDNYQKELAGNEANLVGYWKLNNNYLDETSNNNDLTANGNPVFSSTVPF